LNIGIFGSQSRYYSNEITQHSHWKGVSVIKREYLDWMITARKKANTKSNIVLAWKKAGLVSFNSDLVLAQFLTVKKYISESLPLLIEDITLLDEPLS
jgi:hypothetical protein